MGKAEPRNLAMKVLQDEKALPELLEKVLSKNNDTRESSFQALQLVAEERPELLYAEWDFFARLLNSDNAFHRNMALYLIPPLLKVDSRNKFEGLADTYFALLNSESLMNAGHSALNMGKIAKQIPKLQDRITAMFLNINKTYPVKDRTDNVIGYIIEGFDVYFREAGQKQTILDFVTKQIKSRSPATRKKAEKFLEKWVS